MAAVQANQADRLLCDACDALVLKFDPDAMIQPDVMAELEDYRSLWNTVVFGDLKGALAGRTDEILWDAHRRLNRHFQERYSKLRKDKHRAVETRKLTKSYIAFIKSAQRFYRNYIIRLDDRFDGIPGLRKAADQMRQSAGRNGSNGSNPRIQEANGAAEAPQPKTEPDPELKRVVLLSCYRTLIYLGDLSRYRETETKAQNPQDRNWSPAIGYYHLATAIYPKSGFAHNQLAVIARAEHDHLRATYQLYRALSAAEPHPLAKNNLEVEFKKIRAAWERGEPIIRHPTNDNAASSTVLVTWFVRLHSKCYKGEDFAERDELEDEVLNRLTVEVKERSLDGVLLKMLLINVAAQDLAASRLSGGDTSQRAFNSFFYYMRLNVRTFITLLQIFQGELEHTKGTATGGSEENRQLALADNITIVARRILPGLRLYSAWMLHNIEILSSQAGESPENKELWRAYSNTLTLLSSTFPAECLPTADYMMEEDAETVGFVPLEGPETMRIWYNGDQLRLKVTDSSIERHHPNVEMLVRIRDLVADGVDIAVNTQAPIGLSTDRASFVYQESGLPSELLASPSNKDEMTISTPELSNMRLAQNVSIPDDQASQSVAPSEAASTALAKDAAMNRMVDDLVGQDGGLDILPEEDENIPPTPPEQTFEDTTLVSDGTYGIGPVQMNANDLVNMVHNYSKPSDQSWGGSPFGGNSRPQSRQQETNTIAQAPLPFVPSAADATGIWSNNNQGGRGSSGPSSPYYELPAFGGNIGQQAAPPMVRMSSSQYPQQVPSPTAAEQSPGNKKGSHAPQISAHMSSDRPRSSFESPGGLFAEPWSSYTAFSKSDCATGRSNAGELAHSGHSTFAAEPVSAVLSAYNPPNPNIGGGLSPFDPPPGGMSGYRTSASALMAGGGMGFDGAGAGSGSRPPSAAWSTELNRSLSSLSRAAGTSPRVGSQHGWEG
ncbi:hypothetical protein BDY21DRAFT_368154 [Lineolata rhizophorae]|uniref:Nonsense-mediated mRNA decay factor n=1 Tax=Lineolata rhizophorae TaxID=578093 RepID=A0A6A6PDF2_9PEZI|nr:hypothetical protein BDY21DRAFT_368154 [Lineolata rhizophorae]